MTEPDRSLLENALADACDAALEAWRAIEPLYRGRYEVHQKVDGPVTDADRLADRIILERLRERYRPPEFGYLTEESEDDLNRLACPHVWIVDPIDGTEDFIAGNGNFAIQIGLAQRMEDGLWRPILGVVYRPVAERLYWAQRDRGAFYQDVTPDGLGDPRLLRVSDRDRIERLRSVVSASHKTSRLMRLTQSLGLEDFWHVGSLGVKVCAIVEAEAEVYINIGDGSTKEWDTCAPELILTEAGGVITDLDGNPLHYNRRDPRHHRGLLATNAPAHTALIQAIDDFMKSK